MPLTKIQEHSTTVVYITSKKLRKNYTCRLRNEQVRKRVTVIESVVRVAEQNKLRWYGHVLRKTKEVVVKHVLEEPVRAMRSTGSS